MRTRLIRFAAVLACGLFAIALPRDAYPDPHAKAKAATQADIDRLEKRIEDQQKLLDNLVSLQQQYLHALIALFPDNGGSLAMRPSEPIVEPKAEPKPIAKAEPKSTAKPHPEADAKPATEPKPALKVKPGAIGTIVGKVKGGTGDTFVYVDDVVAPAHGTATMKQEGKQFVPRVLAVQKGTRVDFPNLDAVFHNVFSVTPDNSFDLGSYRQGESKSVNMSRPGVVSVYCNMHPQMVGYILVVPSSLYARTGQDGFFRLANVPAGHHRIVAWAPNSKPVTTETDVNDSEAATIELELKAGRSLPHTNKDGLPYGSYKD